jgi:fused signal recognition particle receptor
MEWIFLVLAALVVVVGLAVVLVGRRSRSGGARLPQPMGTPSVDRSATTVLDRDSTVVDGRLDEDAAAEAVIDTGEASTDIVVEELLVDEPVVVEPPASMRDRLSRARGAFTGLFGSIRGRAGITADTWDELEETLIGADCGVALASELIDELRAAHKADKITDPDVLLDRLKQQLRARFGEVDRSLHLRADGEKPSIWLFVGVNGVGKTTTIGKLGNQQVAAGHRVMMAAGDTFRAAAAEQLGTWAQRSGADIVRGAEGADPAAIVFDAVESASARGHDLVLADTAGRLHTKTNLMEELRKVARVAEKGQGRISEVLLVIDATTGQNGLVQARQFTDAANVTGVVLTKLDGSAKGGIVLAIQHELGIPVKLVGIGEGIADLIAFDPDEFVDALFAA